MSRFLGLVCLFSVFAAPLVGLATLADGLAASIAELTQPNVIEPVNATIGEDGGSLATLPTVSVFDGVSLLADLPREIPARPVSLATVAADRPQVPPWPFPTRERRLSWLQSLLI
jgi:hypothetical protein